MEEDEWDRDAARIGRDLRAIGDCLDNDPEYQRILNNIVHGSATGATYAAFASSIREFVMLVARSSVISVDLIKRVIRNFLLLWNNRDLSMQVMKEIGEDTFPEKADDIPQEVQFMSDKFIRQYHTVLKGGKEHVRNIRLMVVGMFGVGKSTLVENLVEKTEENKMDTGTERQVESTVGIDVRHCTIRDGKWFEEIMDFDPNERLQEVLACPMPDIPDFDSKDGGSQADVSEEIYNREAWQNSQTKHNEPKDKEEILDKNEESYTNFKEKLLNSVINDDKDCNLIKELERVVNDPTTARQCFPTVSIWDFAGQYIYYSTHHFFLNSRSIYLLLMDVSRDLCSLVKEKTDFPLAGFLPKDFTCLEAFKFWLNSIHMYSSQQVHQSEQGPTVFLVGTHKDMLTGSEKDKEKHKEDYFNEALKSFIETPVLAHVHRKKFLINNLDSQEDYLAIRKEVLELAKSKKYWEEARPAKWIPLEKSFLEFKSEGREIITFDDVRAAGQKNDLCIEHDSELRLFLTFQHSLGNILYYETDLLRNYVILSPQWIIDAFRCFVTHTPNKNPSQLHLWDDFEKKAILTSELINEIFDNKENKYFKDHKNEIIKYMEYLDMIARPVNTRRNDTQRTCSDVSSPEIEAQHMSNVRKSEVVETDFIDFQAPTEHRASIDLQGKGNLKEAQQKKQAVYGDSSAKSSDFYIVPSLLQSRPTRDDISWLIDPKDVEKTPILCMKFRDGFMPPSVFHRLIVICIRKFQIATQSRKELLYNGFAVFYATCTTTLSLWFHDNIIYARLAFYDRILHSEAQNIRQFLVHNLTEILRILPDESRINELMPFEEYIQCSTVSSFQPAVGLMRLRDFFHEDSSIMCDHPTLHQVKKKDAIGIWCYESIQKQQNPAFSEALLKKQLSEGELGRIAMGIGEEYFQLGLELKLSRARMQQIRDTDMYHLPTRVYHVLFECTKEGLTVGRLRNAMIAVNSNIEIFDGLFQESFDPSIDFKRSPGIDFARKPLLKELSLLANGVGDEYWLLGVELGIEETRMQQLRLTNTLMPTRVYNMLVEWEKRDENLEKLWRAMIIVKADIEQFNKVFGN